MKIEKMTGKALVKRVIDDSFILYPRDAYKNSPKELLTRLDRGERAVKAMGYLRSQLWIIVGECMMGASDRDKMQCIEKLLLDTEED